MQLRQLEHFEAVYRLRSFTRAARELYLSQSALSRSIQALEADLGQTLFDRSTQAVEPTDAAEALIGHAVDAVAAARTLVESARLLRLGSKLVLVASTPQGLAPLAEVDDPVDNIDSMRDRAASRSATTGCWRLSANACPSSLSCSSCRWRLRKARSRDSASRGSPIAHA